MASLPAGCFDSGCWTICNGTGYWSLPPSLFGVAPVFAPILDQVRSLVSAVAVWAGAGELPVEAVVCAALALTLLSLLYLSLGEAQDEQTKEPGGESRKRRTSSVCRTGSVEGGAAGNHYTGRGLHSELVSVNDSICWLADFE